MESDSAAYFQYNFDVTDPTPTFGYASVAIQPKDSNTIFRTTDGGFTWKELPSSTDYSNVISISIKDRNTAWVFRGDKLNYDVFSNITNDGGISWSILPIKELFSGSNYNSHTNLLFANGFDYKTNIFNKSVSSDDGKTWAHIESRSDNWGRFNIHFFDSLNGFETGAQGTTSNPIPTYISRTTDGGKTWLKSDSIYEFCWSGTAISNTKIGFICSSISNNILKTSDGGITWDTVHHFIDTSINSTIVGDLCHLYAQSLTYHLEGNEYKRGLFESTDQGKSWVKIADFATLPYYGMYFRNNVLFVSHRGDLSTTPGPNSLWRYQLSPNKPTMIADDIVLSSSACKKGDTVLSFAAVNQCDGDKVILDTIYAEGSSNFTISHNPLGREIVWDTLRVQYEPTDASEDTAFVHFRFKLKGNYFDTVMTIRGKGSSTKDSLSFLATLTKPSVTWEETTELRVSPDKAAANKGLAEIRFDVMLDADVLEPLTNYSTGIGGATIQMNPSTQVGKLTRYPFVVTGNNMTLDPAVSILRLPMRPYVSDTTMTTINVSTIHLNPQDPDYERCTLSATGGGVPFSLELMCGDSLLSRYLGGKPILTVISLKPNPTKSDVTVTFDLAKSGAVKAEVLDVLGNVVKQETLEASQGETKYNISLPDAAEGVYYVRLRYGNETRTGKFVRE